MKYTPQELNPDLSIHSESSLYHKAVDIKVSKLPPGAKIKFSLKLIDARKSEWNSTAYYIANAKGEIDLRTAPSVGGDYLGIYPMGLFWSLQSEDYHQIATNKGYEAILSLSYKQEEIAQKSFYRQSTRELDLLGIQKIQKRDSIFANYYVPKKDEKMPAIIFLGGSGGNFREERTSLYASEGYAVLDLKYFRGEGLPENPTRICP